jgi:hypothetical protein
MAGASLAALAAQALMGVAMLRFFTPAAAGHFAVVAQVAFFWVTLALAQSPLQFLADAHLPPRQALRAALRASLLRWLLLLPLVAGAVWWSAPEQCLTSVLAWAALLALLQMGWYLAQPWALRTASPASAAWARAAPPLLALALAAWLGTRWSADSATGLLAAAAGGYALGALWLLHGSGTDHPPSPAAAQADGRSALLRMAHTVMDAVAGVALVLAWQRQHGAAEASYLAVLLRLFGFLPAIVHAAWAQVLLAQARPSRRKSLGVGLAAALLTGLIGLAGAAVLQATPLAPAWHGLLPYILPMVLWQGSACIFAALSHRPFQQGQARRYSLLTMGFNAVQLAVLLVPLGWAPQAHLWWLAGVCTAGLLALSAWMAK